MDSDTEVLLAVAARRDHVINVIKPALESGQWVVCDRFTESTRAYQGGGGGVDMAWIDRLNQQATLGLKPDRTYLFDAPAELAAQRRSQRGRASDRFESQDAEFFDRVRDVYLNRPQVDSLKRLVIDSSETVINIQPPCIKLQGLPPTPVLHRGHSFRCSFGADGETRTRTAFATTPSR